MTERQGAGGTGRAGAPRDAPVASAMEAHGKPLHVVEDPEGWVIMEEDSDEIIERFETKSQAKEEATEIAKQRHVELVTHGADGTIQERELPLGDGI